MEGDARISSRDEEGKPVDWFVVLKLPTIKTSTSKQVKEGGGYIYMDAHHPEPILSNNSLNDSNHAVAHTLNQIYKNRDSMDSKEESHLHNSPSSSLKDKDNDVNQLALKLSTAGLNYTSRPIATTSQKNDSHDSKDVGYLMYNDTFPQDMDKSASQSRGHAKGVVAFDAISGFWLVHSVRKFPGSQSYYWPDNAKVYGQDFLCITFNFDQFEEIGKQLMVINPSVYDFKIPPKLAKNGHSLDEVTRGKHDTSAPSRCVSLTSSEGQSFISFAKSSKYGKDIYSDLLAPYFKSNLLVQTWQSGRGKKIDSCRSGSYDVTNILKMKLGSEVFPQTKDHSKWAVTDSEGSKWICFGDNNRMESQKNRGGGIVCFENEAVHKYLLDGAKKKDEPPENIADITDLLEANVKICDENDEEDSSTASAIQESLDQQNQRTDIDELDNEHKLVRLCQDLASRVSKTEEPTTVFVDRNSLLTSTLHLVNSEGFSFWRDIRVVFDGEEAEDKGGPRREFFKLLMKEVVNSVGVLQSNQHGESVFTLDSDSLTSEKYKLAGQFVLWSVTHGGPGISALCSNVYSAMSGRPEQMSLDHIKCVTDHLSKSNLEKLMSCSNQAEFSSTMTDITDWLLDQGVTSVDFKVRDTLVKDLLKQQQVYRVESCINLWRDLVN